MELSDVKDFYAGETCVVCGLGKSLDDFMPYCKHFKTIGVNNIAENYFHPTILIVIDNFLAGLQKYWEHKIKSIFETNSLFVFDHQMGRDFPYCHYHVKFDFLPISHYGLDKIFKMEKLGASVTITEIALTLALWLGFQRIGVIGFDLIDHPAVEHAIPINEDISRIYDWGIEHDRQMWNLSTKSLIFPLPYLSIDMFNQSFLGI